MDGILLDRAGALLTRTTGLTFPAGRRSALRRALAKVTTEAGLEGPETLLEVLDRQPELIARLVTLVRIGETYFFRHPEQLAVVSQRILPSLAAAAAAAGDRTIDIWSAGCSTGEEAYSLAILATEVFGQAPTPEVRIAATDIDADALRVAAAATYGRWSFRSDLGDRARWFVQDGAARRVQKRIVESVRFSTDNLCQHDAGLPAGLAGSPGLILCRNVTMYLSPEARQQVASRFLRLLAPGGWLVVAPVELSSSAYPGFEAIVIDGLTFYRRPAQRARHRRHADAPRATLEATQSTIAAANVPTPSRGAARRPRIGSKVEREDAELGTARSLADEGRLAEARSSVEVAIGGRPRDRGGYLLLASVAEAQNDLAVSAAALRRALYLNRSDPVAQFRLGLVEWRLGRVRQARARLATAVRLVDGLDDDSLLAGATDLTAARLRTIARMLGHA